MTETKINSAILDKFSKPVINRVKSDIPDITGKTIDGLYVERKMDVASGETETLFTVEYGGNGYTKLGGVTANRL